MAKGLYCKDYSNNVDLLNLDNGIWVHWYPGVYNEKKDCPPALDIKSLGVYSIWSTGSAAIVDFDATLEALISTHKKALEDYYAKEEGKPNESTRSADMAQSA